MSDDPARIIACVPQEGNQVLYLGSGTLVGVEIPPPPLDQHTDPVHGCMVAELDDGTRVWNVECLFLREDAKSTLPGLLIGSIQSLRVTRGVVITGEPREAPAMVANRAVNAVLEAALESDDPNLADLAAVAIMHLELVKSLSNASAGPS